MSLSTFKSLARCTLIAGLGGLASCSAIDRVANVGNAPALSAIESPTEKPGYRPVRLPMPQPVSYSHQPNSLWRSGARGFFKDQRASSIGDILTVKITIDDKAALENSSSRSRNNAEDLGINHLAGIANEVSQVLSSAADPTNLVDLNSQSSTQGSGSVDRAEELETTIAAVVTQILPNGNLVIEGKQEVRVNYEVRELVVAGIVRPEDISNINEISSDKIAEARISYGGRGQITDVQQPRYGQQVLDILLPF